MADHMTPHLPASEHLLVAKDGVPVCVCVGGWVGVCACACVG